jgi:hypothetical protein
MPIMRCENRFARIRRPIAAFLLIIEQGTG